MSKKNVAALAVAGLIAPGAIGIAGNAHSTTKTQPTTPRRVKTTTRRAAPPSRVHPARPWKIPSTAVTAPRHSVRTMSQMRSYLESQGLRDIIAAGIVGNLYQESTLNPNAPGYGLAQWNASWWASASAWISAHGQKANTAAGQLMYIAANVKDNVDAGSFYSGLRADLQRARSAQQAALVWMNDYEQCDGAGRPGSLSFTLFTACRPDQRQSYAAQAE